MDRRRASDLPGAITIKSATYEERTFIDYERLAVAIDTRDRSYKLLMWVGEAIDRGLIQPSRAAHHSGGPHAATEWLRDCYYDLPEKLRPAVKDIDEFAAFFSTFLTTSFDVVEKPGKRGSGPVRSCYCDICLRLSNAPHLQTKKLYTRDRRQADSLMVECLAELTAAKRLENSQIELEHVAREPATRRFAAYLAYARGLIRRLSGDSDGPASLVLWRLIAWDPRGGRRRDFQLEIDDFRVAENKLTAVLGK